VGVIVVRAHIYNPDEEGQRAGVELAFADATGVGVRRGRCVRRENHLSWIIRVGRGREGKVYFKLIVFGGWILYIARMIRGLSSHRTSPFAVKGHHFWGDNGCPGE
jgi:hypothetical protein